MSIKCRCRHSKERHFAGNIPGQAGWCWKCICLKYRPTRKPKIGIAFVILKLTEGFRT